MRKIVGLLTILMLTVAALEAQELTPVEQQELRDQKKNKKKAEKEPPKVENTKEPKVKLDYTKLNLKQRANDHFMMQYGYDNWTNTPDSINTSGFSRHFNMYVMYDMPFKTNPHFSAAIGAGVSSSNIFFKDTKINLVNTTTTRGAAFLDVSDTSHFEKYKLANVWLEAPVELRYVGNPANTNKSFKAALGLKIGTMVSGYTKGKDFQDRNGNSIYGNKYIEKEKNKDFFNNTRFSATARFGYGFMSISGAYQITTLFKDGAGPNVRPWSIGITISGL